MFILRRVINNPETQQEEINIELSETYVFFTKGRNKETFDKMFEDNCKGHHKYDEVYGFITSKGDVHPLFTAHHNYIMTESGQTFSHL